MTAKVLPFARVQGFPPDRAGARGAPCVPHLRERSPVMGWLEKQGMPATLENYVQRNWGKDVDKLSSQDRYEIPVELLPPELRTWTDEQRRNATDRGGSSR